MSHPSPVRAGLLRVVRSPRLLVIEVGWRWAFGLGALTMMAAGLFRLLQALPLTPQDVAALRGEDATMAAAAILHVFHGTWPKFLWAAIVLLPAISVWWVITATMGRVTTLPALVPYPAPRAGGSYGVLGCSVLRVLSMWAGMALSLAIIISASVLSYRFSGARDRPNLLLYGLILAILLPLLGFWLGRVNWYLSLAPLFCFHDGVGAFAGYREAGRAVRQHRAEAVNISLLYGVARLTGIVALIAVSAVVAAVGEGARGMKAAIAIVIVLSLLYFIFADFLYAARLASYAASLLGASEEDALSDGAPVSAHAAGEQATPPGV
jgi:hypothetical protein